LKSHAADKIPIVWLFSLEKWFLGNDPSDLAKISFDQKKVFDF